MIRGWPLALVIALGCAASSAVRAPEVFRVRFETTRGVFVVEVHREWAPIGADRFYELVRQRFFDGAKFFRVRAGAFAQFGISQPWRNKTIPDDPVRISNERGTLAYAFTKPGTRATQMFINLKDNKEYDAQGFAPFGRVVSGMEVADSLYSGYGESSGGGMRAGHQDALFAGGNAWLDRNFPQLDSIVKARLE